MDNSPVIAQPHSLVTLWFVNAADPAKVMNAEPQPDRGFARKYLAQLNPAWPITHIGDFDMTRSTAPDVDEFYIGGYPGLSVIQTIMPGLIRLSELPSRYRQLVSAADVYATCTVPEDATVTEDSDHYAGFGGFAHWSGGHLKRAFSASRETIFEDIGLPDPFESPFWSGNAEATGIELPFIPRDMALAAAETWLGFATDSSGPDIPITAFAVDGRKEMISHEPPAGHVDTDYSADIDDGGRRYDDYTPLSDAPAESKTNAQIVGDISRSLARQAQRTLTHAWSGTHGIKTLPKRVGDQVRRRARNFGRK